MRKPRIHFAGKISMRDWRSAVVPKLQQAEFGQPVDCGSYVYAGPFFVSCDHDPEDHPMEQQYHTRLCRKCAKSVRQPPLWTIPALCCRSITTADLLFAWIDAPDCFNTLIEIGWAQQRRIRTFVCFRNAWLSNEMWFASYGPWCRCAIVDSPVQGFEFALRWLQENAACA